MNDREILHKQILDFYDGAVDDHYAFRCLEFFEQKKKQFSWLFGDQDRIRFNVSETDAANYFHYHNVNFRSLFDETDKFLKEINSPVAPLDLELAIFKNRIRYKKNDFKFTKFYHRFIKTEEKEAPDFQDLYDKLKTVECVLSIHPLDFLGASENSSFSSCLSIDSCHHTATTAYLRDDFTIMAYTIIDEKKIGRQWIHFKGYYIIMGNIYGCISLPVQEKIRKFIEEKYALHLKIPNRWLVARNRTISEDNVSNCGHGSNDHSDYSVYFDLTVNAAIRHKEKTTGFEKLCLDFYEGLDRHGDDTEFGHLNVTYCSCCDQLIEGENNHTDDGPVCDSCLNDYYTYCYDCENYFNENHSMYYIEDEDHFICESCYESGDYGFCEMTDKYYCRDNLVELLQSDGTTILVNEDHAEKHYYKCDICERYHEEPLIQVVDDNFVCDKCLEENYELIDGSYVLKEEQAA